MSTATPPPASTAPTTTRTGPHDVIVVGAGLGGLSAAAHLAACGRRVLVLERYSVLGGSSHVFRRGRRWEFDCGVHYIGDCGPEGKLPRTLRSLGLAEHVEFLPLEEDGFDRIVGPDLDLRVPFGWDRYLENLLEAFPEDARGVRRVVSVLRTIAEAFDRSLTPTSPAGYRAALRHAGAASAYALLPYIALLVRSGLRPRTILAMSVQNGALAATPTRLTTLGHAMFLDLFVGGGAYYPKGGGQRLGAGFAEVVRAHDGELRTNAEVSRILVEGGRVRGVRLADGRVERAPVVVSDADIVKTHADLVGLEHFPRARRLTIRRWRMSRPLINGFFGVRSDLRTAPNANWFVIPGWDDASSLPAMRRLERAVVDGRGFDDGREWARAMAARRPMFVQCSTTRDPDHAASAPPGHAAVEVQTIAPHAPHLWGVEGHEVASGGYRGSARYAEVKKIVLDGMAQRMERAYPGSASRIELAELGTPATQERFVGNTGGAPMGLEMNPAQSVPFRPGTRTAIEGLFLAGTSTAWGPGTDGSMTSGQQAAAAILGRDLAREIRDGRILVEPGRIAPWAEDFDPLRASRAPALRT